MTNNVNLDEVDKAANSICSIYEKDYNMISADSYGHAFAMRAAGNLYRVIHSAEDADTYVIAMEMEQIAMNVGLRACGLTDFLHSEEDLPSS